MMLTTDVVKVEVTRTDIIQANEDYCPITHAISYAIDVDGDQLEISNRRVIIFDEYDSKRAVYSYGEGEGTVKSFLDSWYRHLCGCDENFEEFEFELIKRK